MSKTRIGVIAAAGAGIAGVLLGAPLISSATTPDTTPDTGATTTTTGGTTGDSSSGDTTPGTTNGDGTATSDGTADDSRCRDRGRGGRRGPGGGGPRGNRTGRRGPGGGGTGGRGPHQQRADRPGGIIDRDELAELLGVTQDELRTALKDGDSIADIATAQGVDVDVVIDSLVEDAQARITERRDRINERLDERSGAVEERITDIVTGD